jgi:tRNA A-37 threonylcarbamoyl transferase component Bud32
VQTTLFCGRYRVVRRLGSGATATVFLAEDERLERRVAVKRLHGAEVTEATAERLRREARIMASLRHPNLVAVYDMLTEDDDLYLVMEYVEGETLAEVLGDAPLRPDRVLELLEPVAEALDHAHGHGVVHRDVKPSNVLVGSRAVKLADLGLATAAEITRITPPGSIVGTPAYMAPEQAQPLPCTPAVDVYALATIAFQALSGTLPRTGATTLAVLRQATEEPVPDLRDRRPGTPPAVAAALDRGMAREPEKRQASAGALIRELADGFEQPRRRVPAPAAPPRRDRAARALALLALVTAIAVVAAVVLATRDDGAAEPRADATRTAVPTATAEEPTPEPTPRALSATATVRAFYTRAADGDFAGAWRLAGPGMRAVFGNSRAEFERQLSSLERIEFERLAVVERGDGSATVDISSVATHTDRVDRCTGTLRTVRSNGRWLVEPAGLQCETD